MKEFAHLIRNYGLTKLLSCWNSLSMSYSHSCFKFDLWNSNFSIRTHDSMMLVFLVLLNLMYHLYHPDLFYLIWFNLIFSHFILLIYWFCLKLISRHSILSILYFQFSFNQTHRYHSYLRRPDSNVYHFHIFKQIYIWNTWRAFHNKEDNILWSWHL